MRSPFQKTITVEEYRFFPLQMVVLAFIQRFISNQGLISHFTEWPVLIPIQSN